MQQPIDIRSQIEKLLENDLRDKICKPLLCALEVSYVKKYHGSREEGKDLYFAYESPFGDFKHSCLFIKAGEIKMSGRNDPRLMQPKMQQAICTPFTSPIDNHTQIFIEEFYLLCNGEININAREYLRTIFERRQFPNYKVYDIDSLVLIIKRIIAKYAEKIDRSYVFSVDTFTGFCNKIVKYNEQFRPTEISYGMYLADQI